MSSKKCPQCGLVNWADADSCKRCDLNFSPTEEDRTQQTQANPQFASAPNYQSSQAYDYYPTGQQAQKSTGLAVASLVLGILSFMTMGLLGVGAVVAIVMGVVALKRTRKNPAVYGGDGFAIAGVVLGSISVLMFGYVLVIAAIAIPNLLSARRAANEAGVISSMRGIASAEMTYFKTLGGSRKYATLKELADEGLIERALANGTKYGYRFELVASGSSFELKATPMTYGRASSPGRRSFFISSDSGYVVRAADKKGLTADASDPPLAQPRDFYDRSNRRAIRDSNYDPEY